MIYHAYLSIHWLIMMSSKFVRVISVEVGLRYLLDVMLPRCMCGMLIGFTFQVYDLVVFDYGRGDVPMTVHLLT